MGLPCVIGVDLGGTNVRACAYYTDGTPAGERSNAPSNAQDGVTPVIDAITSCILSAVKTAEQPPIRIGMAVPGHIDDISGLVRWSPNFGHFDDGVFHSWRNVEVRRLVSEKIDLPIRIGNDANVAALGEYQFGSGRGLTPDPAKCLVLLTVGTGIGGGVILGSGSTVGASSGPLMLVGGNGGGAELGHLVIQAGGLDCTAGTYGAIEAYCQRDSIVNRAVHRLIRGRKSILTEMVQDLADIEPLHLYQAAERGDELSIQVWGEVGTYLGIGIANCINVFAPDVVAIGGQIVGAGEWLLGPARLAARDYAIPSLFEDAIIQPAQLLDDAGILGAVALASA